MAQPCAALRTISFELCHRHAYRHTCATAVTVRAIGKDSAAAKPHLDQLAIHVGIDQMRGCGDLRPRLTMLEIAARIRRGCVKLQRRKGQLLEIGHVSW